MIISFLNQKGGVGKTTLSTNIATYLAIEKKARVLLIDADPQNSSLDWAAIRADEASFTVISITKPIIHTEVKKLKPNYDYIIIDGAPRIHDVAKSVIVASDVVIIPVQPSPYDCWAAKEVVDLVKEVSIPLSEIKTIKSTFMINRKIPNTAIGRDIEEALKHYEIDVLDTHICQRVIYAEAAAIGQSVIESKQKSLAKDEITNLAEEILKKHEVKNV